MFAAMLFSQYLNKWMSLIVTHETWHSPKTLIYGADTMAKIF